MKTKNKIQHTPGPWKAINWGTTITISANDKHENICSINSGGNSVSSIPSEEDSANAKLIASGPELLEAAILALMDFENEGIELNNDTVTALRLAINKATGK